MREDDPTVDDGTLLYRRINPRWIVYDDNRKCRRLESGAFQNDEMSVALGDTLDAAERDPKTVLDRHPDDFALVAFPARVARQAEQAVCRDPVEDEPAHGLVVGKKNKGRKRLMARAAVWVVAPAGACEPPTV